MAHGTGQTAVRRMYRRLVTLSRMLHNGDYGVGPQHAGRRGYFEQQVNREMRMTRRRIRKKGRSKKHAHKLHTHTHAHRLSLSGHNFDHANEYRTHMSRLGLYYPLAGRVADLFLHGLHGGKARWLRSHERRARLVLDDLEDLLELLHLVRVRVRVGVRGRGRGRG